jgi:hypothetical protein
VADALKASGRNIPKALAYSLEASLEMANLYVLSNSVIPFGASLLATYCARQSGVKNILALTALSHGTSMICQLLLDPGRTISGLISDSAVSAAVGAAGAAVGYKSGEAILNYVYGGGKTDRKEEKESETDSDDSKNQVTTLPEGLRRRGKRGEKPETAVIARPKAEKVEGGKIRCMIQ